MPSQGQGLYIFSTDSSTDQRLHCSLFLKLIAFENFPQHLHKGMICLSNTSNPLNITSKYQTPAFMTSTMQEIIPSFPFNKLYVPRDGIYAFAEQKPRANRLAVWCIWNEVTSPLAPDRHSLLSAVCLSPHIELSPFTT